jgi:mono/diheme cytochrome c family protein
MQQRGGAACPSVLTILSFRDISNHCIGPNNECRAIAAQHKTPRAIAMPLTRPLYSCTGALALYFLIFTGSAISQSADVLRGQDIVAKQCAGCHETGADKGREQNGHYVPSLREVANTPHYSLVRLRRIIAVPPHSDMPDVALSTSEINDVAAYIHSLTTKAR